MKRAIGLLFSIVLVLTSCMDSGVPTGHQEATNVEEVSTEKDESASIVESESEAVKPSDNEPETLVEETDIEETDIEESVIEEVEVIDPIIEIMDTMTLEDKIAQLFYISLTEYKQLDSPPVGGLIYFTEDMTSASEVHKEIEDLQMKSKIPLFIGIDEEGGIVSRITGDNGVGGTGVPTPWKLSQIGDYEDVYEVNSLIGREINALGFNMNFAPVGDVRTNIYNPIIGKRAYNEDATTVANFVTHAMTAYRDTAIIPVVKHFPGHGDTIGDSHIESVKVDHDIERLMSVELLPFIAAIEAESEMIMVGHIKVPQVTVEDLPASLSKEMIQGLLVESLGYQGLVISDALNMNGITNYFSVEEVISLGFDAGLDMFLMPDDYQQAYDHLMQLVSENESMIPEIDTSVYKIIEMKIAKGIYDSSRLRYEISEVGSEENKAIVQGIYGE